MRPRISCAAERLFQQFDVRPRTWSMYYVVLVASLSCTPRSQPQVSDPGESGIAKSAPTQLTSTPLTAPTCVTLQVQSEGGNSTQRCPGTSGYQLLVVDSDSRMSVTVVDPKGREWPLSYDKVISSHFTSLGPVALWRVVEPGSGGESMALVVKVNANEDPESEKVTPYWAVARVTPSGSCVTERVEGGSDEEARLEAAISAVKARPCLLAQPAMQ